MKYPVGTAIRWCHGPNGEHVSRKHAKRLGLIPRTKKARQKLKSWYRLHAAQENASVQPVLP